MLGDFIESALILLYAYNSQRGGGPRFGHHTHANGTSLLGVIGNRASFGQASPPHHSQIPYPTSDVVGLVPQSNVGRGAHPMKARPPRVRRQALHTRIRKRLRCPNLIPTFFRFLVRPPFNVHHTRSKYYHTILPLRKNIRMSCK